MFLYGLLTSSFLFEIIYAGQQPVDINFQANLSEATEKSQINSTINVLQADINVLDDFKEDLIDGPSGPWSREPECVHSDDHSEEYCVYTDKTFARGRGISIFTSPTIASKFIELSAFTNRTVPDHVNNFKGAPWEVRNVPGRGNGLFATRAIHRGDLIIADTPVAVLQSDAFFLDYGIGYKYLHMAFDQLSDATREIVMNTAAHSAGDPYMERINTNAFAGDFGGAPHFLLYPETALINHDCRPNTQYYHDAQSLIHASYASRTILPGEEITITYISLLQSRSERREMLKQTWGFECQCSLCSRPDTENHISDTNIARINHIQTHLSDWTPTSLGTSSMAEELLSLYEKEGIHAAQGLGHMLTALAYNAEGDTSLARKHAKLAVRAGIVTDGSREPSEDDMDALRENPWGHWSYLKRKKRGGNGGR